MKNPIAFLIVEDSPMRAKRHKRYLEQHSYRAKLGYTHLLRRKLD